MFGLEGVESGDWMHIILNVIKVFITYVIEINILVLSSVEEICCMWESYSLS